MVEIAAAAALLPGACSRGGPGPSPRHEVPHALVPVCRGAPQPGSGHSVPARCPEDAQDDRYGLEVRHGLLRQRAVQLYFDRGTGINESDSTRVPVTKGAEVRTYWLMLPSGTYRSLRLDPLDHAGTFTLAAARVTDNTGRTVRNLAWSQFKPLHQIQSLGVANGSLEIVTEPGGDDPQLQIDLDPPLQLDTNWADIAGQWSRARSASGRFSRPGWRSLHFSPRSRSGIATAARAVTNRPGWAIALVAAAAVTASSYPVVFLGRSFVSPNFGTPLLYDGWPTLPGYSADHSSDVKGSDVGAIMWQHVPLSMIEHRAVLRDFELPLWNRYNAGGLPLLGQGQSMFGDPLHLLVVAANGAAWAWDLKYLIAKWLLAFGLGLIVLAVARHLPSALLISLGAPFVGFFVYRVNHPAFFSMCYSPWPLYCWIRAARAFGLRAAAGWLAGLVLANLALLTSGTVKEAYMLLLTLNLAGVSVLLGRSRSLAAAAGQAGGRRVGGNPFSPDCRAALGQLSRHPGGRAHELRCGQRLPDPARGPARRLRRGLLSAADPRRAGFQIRR